MSPFQVILMLFLMSFVGFALWGFGDGSYMVPKDPEPDENKGRGRTRTRPRRR